MKNLLEIESQITSLIAKVKSKKAGSHSWKNSREESEEAIAYREWHDKTLDDVRADLIKLRELLRETIGCA